MGEVDRACALWALAVALSSLVRHAALQACALVIVAFGSGLVGQFRWGPVSDRGIGAFAVSDRGVITVGELASAWAPVLWFADYEPLFDLPSIERVPESIPGDPLGRPDELGVVYYRATVITERGGVGFTSSWDLETANASETVYRTGAECQITPPPPEPHPECLMLDSIGLIRLQYLLYFSQDMGGGGHPHDFEIAEIWLGVTRLQGDPEEQLIWLDRVVGYAHGHKAFANKLDPRRGDPTDPVELPLTFLIERGKHAPAVDRTRDGDFTPGFDVNIMVADAWGVRDVFGSQWLGSRAYSSWMTLPRVRARCAVYKGHVPGVVQLTATSAGMSVPRPCLGEPAVQNYPDGSTFLWQRPWRYELRALRPAVPDTLGPGDFLVYLRYHEYDKPPQDGPDRFFGLLERFGAGLRFNLGVAPYTSWMGPEVPFIGGHPVLTGAVGITFQGTGPWWTLSALYSPAIAGFYNVYGGVTWADCSNCPSVRGRGFGPEAGFKLRIPIPQVPAPEFVGVRVGLRFPKFRGFVDGTFVVEVGLATP